MTVNVCLVCLNQFENEHSSISFEQNDNSLLLNRFLKFVQNYLQIPSATKEFFPKIADGESFCEKCELAVISPICQVYLEFLSAQLRLSWELGQLEKLLNSSKHLAGSEESRLSKLKSLSLQLGIQKVSELNEFRTSLTKKCKLKKKELSPFIPLQRNLPSATLNFNETLRKSSNSIASLSEVATVSVSRDEDTLKMESKSLNDDNDADDRGDDLWEPEPLDLESDDSLELPRDSVPKLDNFKSFSIKEEEGEKRLIKIKIYEDDNNSQFPQTGAEFDIDNNTKLEAKRIQNQKNHDCPHCRKKFSQKANLNMHIGKMHPQAPGVKQCKICSMTFLTQGRLEMHLRRVHSGRPFPCSYCNKSFKLKGHLVAHVDSVHKPKPSKCQHCGKMLKTIKYLNDHIAQRHPEPGYQQSWPKCPKCGKQFYRQDHLKRHVLTCSASHL